MKNLILIFMSLFSVAAAFKFTAEDLAALMKGEKLKTINNIKINGKITILGAADLNGPWSENNPDAKFFKAEMSL